MAVFGAENEIRLASAHHSTLNDDISNWLGCVVGGQGHNSQPDHLWSKKVEAYCTDSLPLSSV